MKNINILTILFLLSIIGYAQSPLPIDIETLDFRNSIADAYYKDINNYYDDFEGTWVYTNGTTSFKIVLTKYTMRYTGKFYMDDVAGEYQYIENGVELVNTLSNTIVTEKGIWGSHLVNNNYRPICTSCAPDERRLLITFTDRDRHLSATVTFKKTIVGSQPALEAFIWGDGVGAYDADNPPAYFDMRIPYGNFTFIKQ